jgi:hypothetical protein
MVIYSASYHFMGTGRNFNVMEIEVLLRAQLHLHHCRHLSVSCFLYCPRLTFNKLRIVGGRGDCTVHRENIGFIPRRVG